MAQSPFAALQGHNRVLVVFSPDGQDDRFRNQLAQLDGKEMADRDLTLVPVLVHWDQYDADLGNSHAPFTSAKAQADIRRHLHVPPGDFTVILLGKDGGEKLRSHKLLTMEQLNNLIDSMPMRRQEMQSRHPQ